jgi:FkbM family methyltransferase
LPNKRFSILRDLRRTLRSWRDRRQLANLVKHDGDAPGLAAQYGLRMDELGKLKMIADLRGESLPESLRNTFRNLLGSVPARIIDRNVLRDLDVQSVDMHNGLVCLTLKSGRMFYSYPSRLKYACIYNAMWDLCPPQFNAETYQAGVDAVVRYKRLAQHDYMPGEGGVMIEGGAYLGYKAIRFAENVGPTGRVIAIEIGRQNFELMSMNIRANGLQNIITTVHCGIWSSNGTMEAEFSHANWYHLAAPEEQAELDQRESVPTRTLDDIIDGHQLGTVDFLNLQTNGAEYEGLLGLDRRFNDVKVLRIAAYYTRDGESQAEKIREHLRSRNCVILSKPDSLSITAVTPRFAAEIQASRPVKKQRARSAAAIV